MALDSPMGMIGVWKTEGATTTKVRLPEFQGGVLRNEAVSIVNIPTEFTPDESGCFCFPTQDDRMAWVHTYYYATAQVRHYNSILKGLGQPELRGVVIHLAKGDSQGEPGGGTMSSAEVALSFAQPALDPTIIAHEIGHALHLHLLKKSVSELIEYPPKDWRKLAGQSGVLEGTANLLAALYLGEPLIGKYDWFDASIDVNRYVNLVEDAPTLRYQFERKVKSSIYSKHYPATVALLQGWLANPLMPEAMELPDPYLASAAVNQPLWGSAVSLGFGLVEMVYLKAIAGLPEFSGYSDLASEVLRQASLVSTAWCKDLSVQFRARGVEVAADLCDGAA
ncbi:MAG: hypothetical protein NDJ89_07445 [Oligoflexia bacterium]|nr:hypothetical protein [Oligoflexia bacterium]